MRCNCSICKRKGYIIGVVQPDDFKLTKGEELLTLYQFYTKTAKHYFCKVCGIHTHNRPRSNPKIYGVNIACVEGIRPFEIENISFNPVLLFISKLTPIASRVTFVPTSSVTKRSKHFG